MLSRGAGAKAGASAAYQSGGRFRTVIAAAAYQAGVGLTIGADLREAWAAKGQDPVSAVADFTGKSGVHHIARVARQRGVALQPLQPSKPRIRDEYVR
ncbi:hypothetical protein [Azospirillum thiophilum]|nr:hypothetical protein [Azospirillum thiophilum]